MKSWSLGRLDGLTFASPRTYTGTPGCSSRTVQAAMIPPDKTESTAGNNSDTAEVIPVVTPEDTLPAQVAEEDVQISQEVKQTAKTAEALENYDKKEDAKEVNDSTSQKAKASVIPGLPQEDIGKAKEKKKKEEKRRRQKDNQKEKKGQHSLDQSLVMTPDQILSQEFDFQQCSDDSKNDPFEDSVEVQDDLYTLPQTPKLFK